MHATSKKDVENVAIHSISRSEFICVDECTVHTVVACSEFLHVVEMDDRELFNGHRTPATRRPPPHVGLHSTHTDAWEENFFRKSDSSQVYKKLKWSARAAMPVAGPCVAALLEGVQDWTRSTLVRLATFSTSFFLYTVNCPSSLFNHSRVALQRQLPEPVAVQCACSAL